MLLLIRELVTIPYRIIIPKQVSKSQRYALPFLPFAKKYFLVKELPRRNLHVRYSVYAILVHWQEIMSLSLHIVMEFQGLRDSLCYCKSNTVPMEFW